MICHVPLKCTYPASKTSGSATNIGSIVVTNQPHSIIIGIQSIAGLLVSDHDVILFQDRTCYTTSESHLHV